MSLNIRLYSFLSLLVFSLNSCYVLSQGWGQMEILRRRRAISKVLRDPQTSLDVRAKLLFVEEVRDFAEDQLKLNVRNTYKYYTQLDRSILAWNVIASESLALKPKTWWFPIVGEVPYLGFFDHEDAKAEAQKLRRKGWDSKINTVAAYSTLGWFDDPLISTQLSYPNWYLAMLLIHECAHATIWFPGDVSFNEAYASFVGRQGALQFYQEKYGEQAYQRRLRELNKNRGIVSIYRRYIQLIQKVYGSKLPDEQKLQRKKVILGELENILVQVGFRKPAKSEEYRLNNADLISFRYYRSGNSYFNSVLQKCKGDWECFLRELKKLESLSKKKRGAIWRKRY